MEELSFSLGGRTFIFSWWKNFHFLLVEELSFSLKELMVNGDDLTLREIESTIKKFIKTKIPPKNLLQAKLSGFREDRIGNALIPSKHFPSHTPTVCETIMSNTLTQLSIPKHANYVFSMSLSNKATFELQNSHESKLLCIKRQAFINLNSETAKESECGSLVCLLALSNVVDSQIMSIYPASGTDYDTIMNGVIIPRRGTGGMLHILWSRTTSLATQSGPFQPNHFCPVILITKSKKMKQSNLDNSLTRLSKDTLEQSSSANSSPSNFVVDSIIFPMVRSSLTVTASTSTHGLGPSEKLSIKSPPRKCISVPPTRSFVKPKITMFMSNQKTPSNQLSVQTGTFNHKSDTSTGDINDTLSSMCNDKVVEEKNNSTGIIHGDVEEVTSIKYPFDICLYIDKLSRVSEGEQHKLIDNIWHEVDNFSFPKKVCGNRKESSCQKKWSP